MRDKLLNDIKNSISKLKISDKTAEENKQEFHAILTKTPTVTKDGNTVVSYVLVGENEAVGEWKSIALFDENDNLLFIKDISFTHNQGDRVIVKYNVKI